MSSHAISADPLTGFQWKPQPEAQALINELIHEFMPRCEEARTLADRMQHETGTRFLDWLDHIAAPRSADLESRLLKTGFEPSPAPGAPNCFEHFGAMFPRIILHDSPTLRMAIKAEFVADFVAAQQIHPDHPINGEPLSPFRSVLAFRGRNAELWAIERHGHRGFEPLPADPRNSIAYQRHLEALRRRDRDLPNDNASFAHLHAILDGAIADLGVDWACDAFFAAERDFWQRRNRAGHVQKMRQDRLGLGWANHDHHTYRASREHFAPLVGVLEKLGMKVRERFYAGAEAGWGAQVLEQPVTGITVFADVDMSAEELMGDFSHQGLPARDELGTVGLWCGLHGDSILQAGMHHLEAQFNHEALRDQLMAANIETMKPFTAFPYLRQAFTEGERWQVPEKRIERLLERRQITAEQANQFRMNGAIGSHLENLERNDGFKGFNQQGVSDIIARTDPRRQSQETKKLVGA